MSFHLKIVEKKNTAEQAVCAFAVTLLIVTKVLSNALDNFFFFLQLMTHEQSDFDGNVAQS